MVDVLVLIAQALRLTSGNKIVQNNIAISRDSNRHRELIRGMIRHIPNTGERLIHIDQNLGIG